MCVCGSRDVFRAGAVLHCQHTLGNHLSRVGADDVYTENLVSLLLREDLDETVRVEVGLCARVGREVEFANGKLHASRFELLFGLSYPCDLGVRVDNGRDRVVVYVSVPRLEEFDGGDTLEEYLENREH